MDIQNIAKLVSALKGDSSLLSNFSQNPVAVVEKFLGVDLPDDQINALISGLSAKFLGTNTANAVDNSGVNFADLISNLANLDANGDGKFDLNDLGGLSSKFFGNDSEKPNLGNILNSFKI